MKRTGRVTGQDGDTKTSNYIKSQNSVSFIEQLTAATFSEDVLRLATAKPHLILDHVILTFCFLLLTQN